MMLPWWKQLPFSLLLILFLPIYILAAILPARRKLFIWGSAPVINMAYWARAIDQGVMPTMTIMTGVQPFDAPDCYDRVFNDFAPKFLPSQLRFVLGGCLAQLYVLRHAKYLGTSCFGMVFGYTQLGWIEPYLYKLAGIKTVVIPFGADGYIHARIIDTSILYGLLASRPDWARHEERARKRVEIWKRHADVMITGLMVDGIGRWDVTTNQPMVIDTDLWTAKTDHNDNDGRNGVVRVLHTPSYRGFKGTEFVIDAVEKLKAEGLLVELVLLEGVPNDQVRQRMQGADMLAEQFLAIGYGVSGLEGLASGLPVLANLSHEAYTRVFRRFGFLNECPIVSSPPEMLVTNIRALVTNPALRRQLGKASRDFAEKYQSYETARYMFRAVIDKLEGKDVDIMNLFHPLLSEYNKRRPQVDHPLIENRLPAEYVQ
ncbi:MAG: hypothetical protein ABI673_01125 [Novosphingobium sp.]